MSSSSTCSNNSTNVIDKVEQKIKAPQWSMENIDAWIAIVEAQFITCQIVKPISKFYHVISILPPEIVSRIYDVVSVEKPTEDSYSKLINALKTRLVKSNISECEEVHESIYSSIHLFEKEFGDGPGFGKHVLILPNSIGKLQFARNKIMKWKLRCQNLKRTQIIMCSGLTIVVSLL